MNHFCGKLDEKGFEFCRIDYFEDVKGVSAFFLSHFHRDHMTGISSSSFGQIFEERNDVYFYCTEITKRFIEKDPEIKIPNDKIYILEQEEIYITHGDTCVKVTPMRAGHCPGSIMLLFESFGGRVLYTGDFRLTLKDLEKTEVLHEGGQILKLDNIYLDTTFALPLYRFFPERELSFKIIKELMDRSKILHHITYTAFIPTASVGVEYLMIELHKSFKKFIHVSDFSYDRFHSRIQPLENIVTTDISSTDIHFCSLSKCNPCPLKSDQYKVLKIKPSAMYFNEEFCANNELYVQGEGLYYRVNYSSHSSLNELNDFVNYLKPAKIIPLVIPNYYTSEMVINIVRNWRNKEAANYCL